MKNITRCLDFHFQKTDLIAVLALILSSLYIKFFNITEIYENGFFENIALIPLIIGAFMCFTSKKYFVFFRIVALLFVLMILRELSYGRVIFCEIPGHPHEFYPWSHYKYGFLAHIAVGLYIFIATLYGILNKVWLDIIEIVKKVKFPVWTAFSAIIFVFVQIYFEHIENSCIEETAELVLYCLMVSFCFIYLKQLKD